MTVGGSRDFLIRIREFIFVQKGILDILSQNGGNPPLKKFIKRDVPTEEAREFAREHGLHFCEASAKTGENVEEAFLETARQIYQKIQEGSLELNAADSGVQTRQNRANQINTTDEPETPQDKNCSC